MMMSADEHSMIMSADAHNMMMKVFMGEHDTKDSADLRTLLQTTSLTREGPGGV